MSSKVKAGQQTIIKPPVVAVLGHVDHGKTTLLDFIRKTSVAAKEHGGITQHIGAYQISTSGFVGFKSPGDITHITFIDTPGHQAFNQMRSRGAGASDIVLLVVAADDSVKPQTVESIKQIQKSNVPFIVVVNKMDMPGANVDKVKQDLAKHGVQVVGFGGEVPIVLVSAKQGTGIPELLHQIVTLYSSKKIPADPQASFRGMVIETKVDKGRGMVATVLVQSGVARVGSALFSAETQIAKVRAMFDEYGKQVREAPSGKPIEVLGFTQLPSVGSVLYSEATRSTNLIEETQKKKDYMPDFLKPVDEQEKQKLQIILKADTAGSIEAVSQALDERITLVGSGVGDITEADVLSAKANKAFVIGFSVKAASSVVKLADTEKVVFRTYDIIYELLDELAEVAAGMAEVLSLERDLGLAEIIAEFPYDGQRVAGVKVIDGRVAKGDWVKIIRNDIEIGRAHIKSVRQYKNEVTKVEDGHECGLLFDKMLPFMISDKVIPFTK